MSNDVERPAIAFMGIADQRHVLGQRIERGIADVLDHGRFILGPEVTALEEQLAHFCGARHCITCASGTDALQLLLMAEVIGPGDAVFVPAFSFVATAEVAPLVGAVPVFVDVCRDSFNIDPASLEAAIDTAKSAGLRPRAVIAVDLFGQPADYDAIHAVADPHGLTIIDDAAQSFGASRDGRRVGTLGHHTATSFYPTKPLGAYGDGGAIFTDDDAMAGLLRSLRVHGEGASRYENARIGLNSRLDTVQAAVLLAKLDVFSDEIAARQKAALRYSEALADVVQTPELAAGASSVWAQYTVVLEERDALAAACAREGVPTAIYYPVPLHAQEGYSSFPRTPTGLANAEWLAKRVLSLPMHPYLEEEAQDFVIRTVRGCVDALRAQPEVRAAP